MSFEEQIMSKDKYLSIFPRQMGAIVFIILQMFFAKSAVVNFKTAVVEKSVCFSEQIKSANKYPSL